ncbi:sorting nexin-18 [Solea senegalensis]|uniref:Sorting nexin n=1 Tax=Solea senegalensis TaxID=28829 RepID=A0AAV6QDR3_SOLSE|nr:sorting nexin-18a [Solea senegalensis]KAG7489350.1 sorting nexin-18 [Solea senegalensis]
MALRARALYDFNSENPGEVSVKESEVLTLFSEQDIEGWFEGVNSKGERGLFPASYVEILKNDAASTTNNNSGSSSTSVDTYPNSRYSNIPPGGFDAPSNPPNATENFNKAGSPPAFVTFTAPPPQQQPQQHAYQSVGQPSDDDWDDDWDDNSTVADEPGTVGGRYRDFEGNGPSTYRVSTCSMSRGSAQQAKSSATVSRNLNRFSTFVKSGGEAFVLGEASGFVKDGDKICVVMGQFGPEWQENPYPFSCTIDDPTKQTKFKGMKSYISYKLTPTHTQHQVNRRYKHFDWLYARLVEKFPVISVPHIPEKQATGRFEEDFISKRRKGLIWWMNHMTSHPVLSKCDVFQHFLGCTDEKAWKQGKRKAEKDDMVGANFFLTISTPAAPLDFQEVESKIDGFKTFTKRMDESNMQLNGTLNEFARKQISGFKKEYQKVGISFKVLSQAFEMDQQVYSTGLNQAISFTGDAYEAVGEYFSEQPGKDVDPIMDLIALYQGHLANYPDIIHVQKGALTKVKESQKHVEEGKMDLAQAEGINERCNIISCATLAEIQHFHRIRVRDFKTQMQHFLQQQISFFQKITGKLEEALQKYDNM